MISFFFKILASLPKCFRLLPVVLTNYRFHPSFLTNLMCCFAILIALSEGEGENFRIFFEVTQRTGEHRGFAPIGMLGTE